MCNFTFKWNQHLMDEDTACWVDEKCGGKFTEVEYRDGTLSLIDCKENIKNFTFRRILWEKIVLTLNFQWF